MNNETHLICSFTADSHSTEYLCLASDSCGTVGTSESSFFTSSNGSNTTPESGRLCVFFEAAATSPNLPFAGVEGFRNCADEEDNWFEPSPLRFGSTIAGEALSDLIGDCGEDCSRSGDWKWWSGLECLRMNVWRGIWSVGFVAVEWMDGQD